MTTIFVANGSPAAIFTERLKFLQILWYWLWINIYHSTMISEWYIWHILAISRWTIICLLQVSHQWSFLSINTDLQKKGYYHLKVWHPQFFKTNFLREAGLSFLYSCSFFKKVFVFFYVYLWKLQLQELQRMTIHHALNHPVEGVIQLIKHLLLSALLRPNVKTIRQNLLLIPIEVLFQLSRATISFSFWAIADKMNLEVSSRDYDFFCNTIFSSVILHFRTLF